MDLLIRLREWGRRWGHASDDPPPTALGFAGAADVNQRGADGLVAMNADCEAGPPEASLKTPTAPADRLAAEGVGGRPDSTAKCPRGSIK